MQITVLFFATLKDLAGEKSVVLPLPAEITTVDAVRQMLISRYPQMSANLRVALAAINEEFAFAGDAVKAGDTLAFFPPVSGGAPLWPEICQLAETPIDHDVLIASITTPETGAVCLFSGMVRGTTARTGHLPQTEYLEYEAYAPMAVAKMRQVAAEIRRQWPKVQGIAIIQRVGRLLVGQNTILIACAAAHRDDGCFEAARYGIDRLKAVVPIWKKEVNSSGAAWIEGSYVPTPEDQA